MNNILPVFVKITGGIPYLLLMRPKYYYEDREKQAHSIRGKAIVMPDHHKIYDVATMMAAFPGRNLRCIISEAIVENNNPFVKLFVKHMGYIVVDRQTHDFAFLSKSKQILDRGGVVELFPESRLPLPGEETPLEFKPSITYLALESGAPIIPVVSNGSFLRKERMRVLIGTPIDVRELYNDSLGEKENIDIITNILRNKIKELKDELDRRTKEKSGPVKTEKAERVSV